MDGFYQVLDRMRRAINISVTFAICTLLWKCAEVKEVDPGDLGTNFFPLETGLVNVYQVNGVRYNSINDSTEFSYLLKESIVDSFENLEMGISYKIERQKKYAEDGPWAIDSIWTARISTNGAVRVENNVATVNLTFPLRENQTWDGNILNGRTENEFEMINVNQSYSDSFGTHNNTVTVIQEEFADFIVKSIFQKEVYAEGKGLVYKENIILSYKQNTLGDPNQYNGKEIVETGLRYYQHLIDYEEQ